MVSIAYAQSSGTAAGSSLFPTRRSPTSSGLEAGGNNASEPVARARRPLRHQGFRFRREVLSRIDEPVPLEAILLVVQLAVPSVLGEQLFVRAAFDDLTVLE